MNFCTKCASYYSQPGTCNCFAARQADGGPWQYPVHPTPTIVPWAGDPWPWPHVTLTTTSGYIDFYNNDNTGHRVELDPEADVGPNPFTPGDD